jgi:NDP-sugar pyrophosphorylase family protein
VSGPLRAIVAVAQTDGLDRSAPPAFRVPALAPLTNRPMILHEVARLRAAGASEVLVVSHPQVAAAIREALLEDPSMHDVDVIETVQASSPAGVLAAAGASYLRGAVLLARGDTLLIGPLAPLRAYRDGERDPLDDIAATIAARHPALPSGDGEAPPILLLDRMAAVELAAGAGERPGWHLGADVLVDGEVRLPPATSAMRYVGGAEALLDLNRLILDELPAAPLRLTALGKDVVVHGRVMIDASARVSSSTICGPAVIGEGAVIENAYIGPYTTIGPRARVLGAEVEESILLEESEVSYLGVRLERSVVGRSARLYRDLTLPRSLRLSVGDGAVVSFA